MKGIPVFLAGLALGSTFLMQPLNQGELTPNSIPPLLAGLGFEPKESGPGTWDITSTRGGLDVPIAVALSKSGRKLWMTVFLTELDDKTRADAPRLLELLRKNFETQPGHFFVVKDAPTSGPVKDSLKMAIALDNRGITPADLKREIDKLSDDVVGSRALWEKP
jgi:hypothetical protein